jgi:serine/threonine protein kinase
MCSKSALLGKGRYAKVYACEGFAFKIAKLKRDRSWKEISTLKCNLKELFFLHFLNHPNIIKPSESQLVMEHGRITRVIHKLPKAVASLYDRIGQRIAIRVPQISLIIASMASALKYMHERNIVHGDITPGNILLFADGSPRLTDFSLTTFQGKGNELAFGTLFWRPPEGMIDGKSDVFALGVVMLDMVFNCVFTRDMLDATDQDEATRAWGMLDIKTMLWDRLGANGNFLSIQCMDLVLRMVALDPTQRCSMSDILLHPFCKRQSPGVPDKVCSNTRPQSHPLAFKSEVVTLTRRLETILRERGATFCGEKIKSGCESFWSYLWNDTWDESAHFESVIYHIATLLDYRVFDVIH